MRTRGNSPTRKAGEGDIRAVLKLLASHVLQRAEGDTLGALGLMGGEAGIILFLMYYAHYIDGAWFHVVQSRINRLVAQCSGIRDISYAEGLLGIVSMILHLQEKNFIADGNPISPEAESLLFQYVVQCMKTRQDDFLYGAAGGMHFFLSAYRISQNTVTRSRLCMLLNLVKERMNGTGGVFPQQWETGIAHGYSAWLILLSSFIELDIAPILNRNVLRQILVQYEQFIEKPYLPNQIFPTAYIGQEAQPILGWNRLGWCSGDLSCLTAMLTCYHTLGDKEGERCVLNHLCTTSKKRDAEKYHVHDAGLCHGFAGIYLMFDWLNTKWPCEAFRDAREYWFGRLWDARKLKQWGCGFCKRYYDALNREIISNERGLLEGISGVGLALMRYVGIKTNWGHLLLID